MHDLVEKEWRHLNFFEHEAYLHAKVPRVRCAKHGVRLIQVPWARAGSGFTLLFEALVMVLMREMPVKAAARIVGEHDTRLWRVLMSILLAAKKSIAARTDVWYHWIMLGEGGAPLSKLQVAVHEFQAREERSVDNAELRKVIDALEGEFATNARNSQKSGEHFLSGTATAATWISRTCNMSVTSAADRLCVGQQLESLPKVAAALSSGEIGFQSASLLCHLRDWLGDKRDLFDEEEMLGYAREYSVFNLRKICNTAKHVADPDRFFEEAEADYTRRRLHVSLMPDGMYAIDGVLDPECGAAAKTAFDPLSKPRGPEDDRSGGQRTHDAFAEVLHHAMDQGTLPRRNGVRPHITVTTTLEALKGEVGVPPADLEFGLPISIKTMERIACDCTISRVLLADSMVIDVGRATRVTSAPRRRALGARDKGCRFPGCDRPVNWTSAHHVIFWARGGPNNLPNEVLLCYYHHRLVHEGGWQVIKAGREYRFVPPEQLVIRRARGPGMRWAA